MKLVPWHAKMSSPPSSDASATPGLDTQQMLRDLESRLFGESELAAPQLGRFTIIGRLGEGGMGTVFAAYDPHLDRKVALKVLRAQGSADNPEGHARLLREAQSLAKLAHPNVVTIHEVGVVDDRVFLTLQYVGGGTLESRLVSDQPDLDTTLDWLLQAGHGLQAAHALGLVHRDVKPANILVDDAGRAMVSDFGLATELDAGELEDGPLHTTAERVSVSGRGATPPSPDGAGALDNVGVLRTATGARVGTPAYMAPEQIDGLQVDARSDQFAFCVTMYRAIEGHAPFAGATLLALRESMNGAPQPSKAMPTWLAKLIERGLQCDPQRRHPSMIALLAAIERGRQPPRWRRFAALSVGAVAVVAAAASTPQQAAAPDRCATLSRALDAVWNDAARAEGEAAFIATERPYAADAWEQTRAALDDYAGQWHAQASDSCRSTLQAGTQSDEAHDLRMMCLGEARLEFESLATMLADADAKLVGRADRIAHGLADLKRCVQVESLRAVGAPPQDPRVREQVAEARTHLAQARTMIVAGRLADALAAAQLALPPAEASGWEPILADALLVHGKTAQEQGQIEQGETSLRRAIDLAEANRADRLLAQAWAELLTNVVDYQQRIDGLQDIARRAEASVRRLHDPPRLRVRMLATWGRGLRVSGDIPGALDKLEQALEVAKTSEGFPADMRVITQHLLANTRSAAGDADGALALRLETLSLAKEALGPQHPRVATIIAQLAVDYMELPDNDKALAAFDEALALRKLLGLRGSANLHGNRGQLLVNMGRPDDAFPEFDTALALHAAQLGEEHPAGAPFYLQKATAYLSTGRYAEAKPLLLQAEQVMKGHLPAEHPYRLAVAVNLAQVLIDEGDGATALRKAVAAQDVYRTLADECGQELMEITRIVGDAYTAAAEPNAALAEYDALAKCWTVREPESVGARPGLLMGRARARAALGQTSKARELAEQARVAYVELGDAFSAEADAATAWLNEHPS